MKSSSVKRNAKNARGLGRDIFPAATAPFPKSRASYFRFARFNMSPPYYLRAWYRLGVSIQSYTKVCETFRQITQKLWATKTGDYILVFYNISFSWLLPLDSFKFIFLLRDSENDLYFYSNFRIVVNFSARKALFYGLKKSFFDDFDARKL